MGKGVVREGTGGCWLSSCETGVLKRSEKGFWSEVDGCGVQGSKGGHLGWFGGDEKVLQGSGWGKERMQAKSRKGLEHEDSKG